MKTCTVEGCDAQISSKGLCPKHYMRLRRTGTTDFTRSPRPTISERFWAKVNKTEGCWEWTASKLAGGYGQICVSGKNRTTHRLSYEMANGPIPEGMEIDHMCHNTSCVRPEHLRLATRKQNMENLPGARADSTTGVRGVYLDKKSQRYKAAVNHNQRIVHLGYFDTLDEAEAAVIAKRLDLFTHNDIDRRAA